MMATLPILAGLLLGLGSELTKTCKRSAVNGIYLSLLRALLAWADDGYRGGVSEILARGVFGSSAPLRLFRDLGWFSGGSSSSSSRSLSDR